MNDSITTHFFYNSNFPCKTDILKNGQPSSLKINKNNKILCKNFLMLYLFLKIFQKTHKKLPLKISIFNTAKKSNIFNFLKAPYKNKLARNQLTTPLFKFSIKVVCTYGSGLILENPTILFLILKLLINNFSYMESNITYLNKVRFVLNFGVNHYWNYKNNNISIMNHHYFIFIETYFFFSKKQKTKYTHTGKALCNYLGMNYRVSKAPICFFIRLYSTALSEPLVLTYDKHRVQNLMHFFKPLLSYLDFSAFKFIF